MNRSLGFIFMTVMVFVFSCETHHEPWNPIIEETGFNYLESSVTDALVEIGTIENSLKSDETSDGYPSLMKTKQILLSLKEYYVPLTIVRQFIYDADRYFYLKNKVEAENKLKKARSIIEKMVSQFKSHDFGKVLEELIVMIDNCMISMNDRSDRAFKDLKILGHKVNLMLVKGELELSGKTLN